MSSTEDVETPAPPPHNPLQGIPPLTTSILTDPKEKVAALKLVADTIAQQRQYASRAIIFHPLTIAAYICILAIIYQFLFKTRGDIGVVLTTTAGVTMCLLVAIRSATAGYIHMAEDMKWDFLLNEDGDEDMILATKFGNEVMAAVILRLERSSSNGGKKKSKNGGGKNGGKGVIRAWAVRIRYRHKGVGTALLEDAVKITRERLGHAAETGFAAEHANSKLLLPDWFNGGFKKREGKAARTLEDVIGEMDVKKKR